MTPPASPQYGHLAVAIPQGGVLPQDEEGQGHRKGGTREGKPGKGGGKDRDRRKSGGREGSSSKPAAKAEGQTGGAAPRRGKGPTPCYVCGSDEHFWQRCEKRRKPPGCAVCSSKAHAPFACPQRYFPDVAPHLRAVLAHLLREAQGSSAASGGPAASPGKDRGGEPRNPSSPAASSDSGGMGQGRVGVWGTGGWRSRG